MPNSNNNVVKMSLPFLPDLPSSPASEDASRNSRSRRIALLPRITPLFAAPAEESFRVGADEAVAAVAMAQRPDHGYTTPNSSLVAAANHGPSSYDSPPPGGTLPSTIPTPQTPCGGRPRLRLVPVIDPVRKFQEAPRQEAAQRQPPPPEQCRRQGNAEKTEPSNVSPTRGVLDIPTLDHVPVRDRQQAPRHRQGNAAETEPREPLARGILDIPTLDHSAIAGSSSRTSVPRSMGPTPSSSKIDLKPRRRRWSDRDGGSLTCSSPTRHLGVVPSPSLGSRHAAASFPRRRSSRASFSSAARCA